MNVWLNRLPYRYRLVANGVGIFTGLLAATQENDRGLATWVTVLTIAAAVCAAYAATYVVWLYRVRHTA